MFARAREKARQTSCLSNLKQLGLAWAMYAQDYDEVTMRVNIGPTVSYTLLNGTPYTGYMLWPTIINPYTKNIQFQNCPSNSYRWDGAYTGASSYGYLSINWGIPLANYTKPSETFVMYDVRSAGGFTNQYAPGVGTAAQSYLDLASEYCTTTAPTCCSPMVMPSGSPSRARWATAPTGRCRSVGGVSPLHPGQLEPGCSLFYSLQAPSRRVLCPLRPSGSGRMCAGMVWGLRYPGIPSHVRPSSSLPARFLFTPPHCLKKKGTCCLRQMSRTCAAHSGCIGRAPGPDSPPTITQPMPVRSRSGTGPRRGSSETNRTAAGTWRTWSRRWR